MKKVIVYLFCMLLVIGISGCGRSDSVQQKQETIIDLREGGDIEKIIHGQILIVSGKVIVGNGKKSSRLFKTEFGNLEAQPLVIQDKNKKEWAVMLGSPSSDSLFEKTITVKGYADFKSNDPAIMRSTALGAPKAAIVKAELLK